MWGLEIGHLTILKRVSYGQGGLIALSDTQGDHGNGWMSLNYVLDSPTDTRDFQVKLMVSIYKLLANLTCLYFVHDT